MSDQGSDLRFGASNKGIWPKAVIVGSISERWKINSVRLTSEHSRLRELSTAAIVQAIGSLASLATISYLAHSVGAGTQGLFSSLKAQFEFFSAFLLLGLPQAIFYYLASKEQDWGQALTLAFVHALTSLVIIGIWASVAMLGAHANFPTVTYVVFFTLAIAIGVFYADVRSLVLATQSAIVFSVVTALPAVFVLLVVVLGVTYLAQTASSTSQIANPIIFVIAYGLATGVAILLIGRNIRLYFSRLGLKEVLKSMSYGFATWIPSIGQTGSNLFAIRWLGENLGSAEGVAGFSTAFALVLAVLAPLGMVIPIFFKWWAPMPSEERNKELAKSLGAVLLLACFCITAIWLLEDLIVPIMFGTEYLSFIGIYSLMSAAILPQAAFRIWGVYCSSSGRPSGAAWLESARLFIIILCVVSLGETLKSTVFAWVLAEYLSLLVGVLFIAASSMRKTRRPI